MPVFYPPHNALPDGTEGAPTIAFATDTNLGFYRASDDFLGFVANGVRSLRFTGSGSIHGNSGDNRLNLASDGRVALVADRGQNITIEPGTGAGVLVQTGNLRLHGYGGAAAAGVLFLGDDSASYLFRSASNKLHIRHAASDRITIDELGAVLIDKTANSSNGIVQLATHSSAAGGLAFGALTGGLETIWRHGGSTLRTDGNFIIRAICQTDYSVVLNRERATGWALATGTKTRTTFDPSTVTLEQLAQRVAALIQDLHMDGTLTSSGTLAGHGLLST